MIDNMSLRARLVYGALLLVPGLVHAALPIENRPVLPYEALAIDATIEQKQVYLGALLGDPHMYEVTIAEPKKFVATLWQQPEDEEVIAFSLILVKSNDNNRGVTEVGRLVGKETVWDTAYDGVLAMELARSETVHYELSPGTYRFEVSTPENIGQYMIVLGEDASAAGYFATLREIRAIQQFFSVSGLRLLLSTHVLYPLGSMLLLALFGYLWYRRRLHHA